MGIIRSFPGIALLLVNLVFLQVTNIDAAADQYYVTGEGIYRNPDIPVFHDPEAVKRAYRGIDKRSLKKLIELLPPIQRVGWEEFMDLYRSLVSVESAV